MRRVVALLVFFVYITATIPTGGKFEDKTENRNDSNNERDLLIVNTIDGTIRALDEKDGSEAWKIAGKPHVSQSITNLEYRNDDGQSYRLVPSLEGALFLVEPEVMRPLPFTAGDLLAQRNNFADNSMLVGAQETEIIVINTETGNIVFNCSRDGCANWNSSTDDVTADPGVRLVVHRRRNTVRSVDVRTGAEKWNFSVSQNDLAAHTPTDDSNFHVRSRAEAPHKQKPTNNKRIIEYTFNIQGGLILATTHNPFASILWQAKLGVSLHKVWSLRSGVLRQLQIITPGQPLTGSVSSPSSSSRTGKSTDTSHTNTAVGKATCPQKKGSDFPFAKTGTEENHFIYFGHFNGQLYVQVDDKSSMSQPVPIPPEPSSSQADDGEVSTVRPSRVQPPPTGFYPSGKVAMIPYGEAEEGESMSVEAYGLSGNPMSWWFQSLMLGLFIFVVVHLVVTRALQSQQGKKKERQPSVPAFDEELGGEMNSAQVQTSLPPVELESTPNKKKKSVSSGIVSLPSTPSVTEQLTTGVSVAAPFESRYLSEYSHQQCLGRGGFGVVFEAKNKLDDTPYAIKRVCFRDRDDNQNRLSREVKALARLEHPGIVRYYMAWIERPPAGWQEARDKEFKLTVPSKPTDEMNMTDLTSGDLDETSVSNVTNANIQSSSYAPCNINKFRKKYSDSDVEIIFPRDQALDSAFDNTGRDLSRISSDPNETSTDNQNVSDSSSSMPPRRFIKPEVDDSVEIIFQRSGDSKISSVPESVNVNFDLTDSKAKKTCSGSKQDVSMVYLYIAMELCAEESLKTWLEKTIKTRPPRDTLFKMFAQMVDTVSYVHRSGLMHRDLKPSNIFFSRSDNRMIKIGDFGLVASLADENIIFARNTSLNSSSLDSSISSDDTEGEKRNRLVAGQTRQRHTDRVGTRLYMSPELEAGHDYDTKVDIFSLGLILLEILVPFETQMERIKALCKAKQGILPDDFSESHPAETTLIKRLLSSDPASRPTCDKILEDPLIRNAYENIVHRRYRNISMSGHPEDFE